MKVLGVVLDLDDIEELPEDREKDVTGLTAKMVAALGDGWKTVLSGSKRPMSVKRLSRGFVNTVACVVVEQVDLG